MMLPFGQFKTALACGVLAIVPASGAVVFTDIPDIGFFSPGGFLTQPIDLNADGVDDVIFRNFGDEFAAFSTSTSAISGIVATLPNLNHFAAPLGSGSIIGPSFASLYSWNEGYSGLISVRTVGTESVILGLWGSVEAYLGVQFKIGEETHYGWILVDTPFDSGGGIIKALAYESEAGMPIFAGAVPEPSAACLVVASALPWFFSRRRKR
jgi:hypothetical protein